MNYHTRSYSEQPQVPAPQSFIRFHSDSQQSLDQLFNPQSQSSVPLRNRNLPLSFFNPSLQTETNETATNGTNNFHSRSISLNHNQQAPAARAPQRLNLHMRTHSTLAPMPRLLCNHSSNQSSQECISTPVQQQNHHHVINNNSSSTSTTSTTTNNNNNNLHHHHHHHHEHHSQNSNGWSSAGNSMDDLSASPNWIAGQPAQNHAVPMQQSAPVVCAGAPQHQPLIQGPVAVQHQQVFQNVNPLPSVPQQPTDHVCPNNLHGRSISFNQRPDTRVTGHGFHMRTHSTIAPMSGAHNHNQVNGHVSSHQSSQDFSINSNNTNTSSSTGWSSSGYSSDDMTSTGNSWTAAGQPAMTQVPHQVPCPMANAQVLSSPTNLHHHHHHNQAATIQHQHQQPQLAQEQMFYHV